MHYQLYDIYATVYEVTRRLYSSQKTTTYVITQTKHVTADGQVRNDTWCYTIFLREAANQHTQVRPYTTNESRNVRRRPNRHNQQLRREQRRLYETKPPIYLTHVTETATLQYMLTAIITTLVVGVICHMMNTNSRDILVIASAYAMSLPPNATQYGAIINGVQSDPASYVLYSLATHFEALEDERSLRSDALLLDFDCKSGERIDEILARFDLARSEARQVDADITNCQQLRRTRCRICAVASLSGGGI